MRNTLLLCSLFAGILIGCGVSKNFITTPVQESRVKDQTGNELLLGHNPMTALKQKPFSDWFEKNYQEYKVDSSHLDRLKGLLADKKTDITVFFGTWCGDSKREVPRMLKILDASGVPANRIHLIAVSAGEGKYKQSPQHEEAGKYIFRVPTFIITTDAREKGRIIESPKENLEKDLLAILQGGPYQPNYSAGNDFFRHVLGSTPSDLQAEMGKQTELLKPILRSRSELSSIGYAMMDAGEKGKAVFIFELNARIYPADIAVYNAMAEGYFAINDPGKARTALEKAKTIDSTNAETIRLLKKLE